MVNALGDRLPSTIGEMEDTLKVPGGGANVTIVSPIFDLRHQHIAIDHA